MAAAAAAWSSVSCAKPWSPPPALLPQQRLPLAISWAVLPGVSLEVPSMDLAAFDSASPGRTRALSANPGGDALVSPCVRGRPCFRARVHRRLVTKAARGAEGRRLSLKSPLPRPAPGGSTPGRGCGAPWPRSRRSSIRWLRAHADGRGSSRETAQGFVRRRDSAREPRASMLQSPAGCGHHRWRARFRTRAVAAGASSKRTRARQRSCSTRSSGGRRSSPRRWRSRGGSDRTRPAQPALGSQPITALTSRKSSSPKRPHSRPLPDW